jgi:predicted nucleic acid-binding protein
MATLIDTSLWIHLTRASSPQRLKHFVLPHITDPSARMAEPVIFELMRHAHPAEVENLRQYFAAQPVLATPHDLWERAATLGRVCRKNGHTAGAIDLLITTIALTHEATILTFDADFQKISAAVGVEVKLLVKPVT